MTTPEIASLFREARRADIEAVAGVKLYRAGRRLRGPCPLCGGGKGKTVDGPFSADPLEGVFKCWKCDRGGDVITLEHNLHGRGDETLADAARRLVGSERIRPISEPMPDPGRRELATANGAEGHQAERLWRDARPAIGTLAERYFASRGLTGEIAAAALARLRFHPRVYHSGSPDGANHAPAIIGQVTTPDGPTGGIHVTFLDPYTGTKSRLKPAKKMIGPQTLNGLRGGLWLSAVTASGPLLVGEGIETSLSAAILVAGAPCRVVAALSLGSLQGGWLPDKFGRFDPDFVQPDPARPAFTWPKPLARAWTKVLIAVDRDMSPVPIKARSPLTGATFERLLTADERAKVCGALAAASWRAVGNSNVAVVAPRAGRDFNDELRDLKS
jgi:hypothetical protein